MIKLDRKSCWCSNHMLWLQNMGKWSRDRTGTVWQLNYELPFMCSRAGCFGGIGTNSTIWLWLLCGTLTTYQPRCACWYDSGTALKGATYCFPLGVEPPLKGAHIWNCKSFEKPDTWVAPRMWEAATVIDL